MCPFARAGRTLISAFTATTATVAPRLHSPGRVQRDGISAETPNLGSRYRSFTLAVPLVIVGGLLYASGLGAALHSEAKAKQYRDQQAVAKAALEEERAAAIAAAKATEQARREALRLAAESVLTKAVGACEIGQELRVEVADEPPKILRIEAVGTELDNEDHKVQKISARLYETVADADGGLKRREQIANIPAFTYHPPLKPDLAPSAPPRGEAKKRLPPCTPSPA
jgi:hypothetical protein